VIGIDSNVIVRYLIRDDEKQTPEAKAILDGCTVQEPGFISLVALIETMWVMKRVYKVSREGILYSMTGLLASPVICVQEGKVVDEALEFSRRENCDMPDVLISFFGRMAGCSRTLTFDRKAANIPGMELVTAIESGVA